MDFVKVMDACTAVSAITMKNEKLIEVVLMSEFKIGDSVKVVEIDEYEYRQLKVLNGKTPNEIIDAFVLTLLESGVI